MPTYQDALSAEPAEFLCYAAEMTAAATDLATQQTDYAAKVAEINGHWQDNANQAFNGEVGNVSTHLTQVIGAITATAGGLAAAGTQMLAECTILKAADAALRAAGFNIQPAPLVQLGPAQRTAIAMAGPFGGFLEAVLQAQAIAGTLGLQSLTSLVNAADATAGAALSQAAELLKPLEDKTSGTGKDLESHATAEDHSTTGAEEEEESSEEQGAEETEEEEEQTEPEAERQQESTQPSSRQPTTPETPSMEDLAQPETLELDNPWDAAELTGPDDLEGGLASGGLGSGGGGGGPGGDLGSGGLATGAGTIPQGGMGSGAIAGVPTGSGAAAAGAGKGAGGGMMGAGGGRGAGGKTDDEVTRESFLIEDPDEDVWGIGKDDDEYA